jgi:hypothetical protein
VKKTKDVDKHNRKVLFKRVGDFVEIAPDVRGVAEEYADLGIKRMGNKALNFERNQKDEFEDKLIGFLGQRMFQAELNRLRVPYLHDELMFLDEGDRVLVGDFEIVGFGSIEVKTLRSYCNFIAINRDLWRVHTANGRVPDYVVALKMNDAKTRAKLCGWLLGSEVADLPTIDYICPNSPCHAKRLDELRPYSEFERKLQSFHDKTN